jgi:hypothetical protein
LADYVFTNADIDTGGVFSLDSDTGRIRKLLSGPNRGLTLGPDEWLYTVSGYRNSTEEISTIHRVHPEEGRSEEVARLSAPDAHDLRWIGDAFYLVSTIGNRILRLDSDFRETGRLSILADERDVCHANCIAAMGDELYCSIFTLSPGARREKRLSRAWFETGKLLHLDFGRGAWEVAYEPLAQPHSLTHSAGCAYLVESHTASFARIDINSGEKHVIGQYTGFVRGLALGEEEAVLGVNQMHRGGRRRLRPLPLWKRWEERLRPFTGLLVVDPTTGVVRRRVPLPECARVYDIVELPRREAKTVRAATGNRAEWVPSGEPVGSGR